MKKVFLYCSILLPFLSNSVFPKKVLIGEVLYDTTLRHFHDEAEKVRLEKKGYKKLFRNIVDIFSKVQFSDHLPKSIEEDMNVKDKHDKSIYLINEIMDCITAYQSSIRQIKLLIFEVLRSIELDEQFNFYFQVDEKLIILLYNLNEVEKNRSRYYKYSLCLEKEIIQLSNEINELISNKK